MKLKFYIVFIISAIFSTQLFSQNRDVIIKEFATTKNDSVFITKYSARPYQKYLFKRDMGLEISNSLFDSLIFFHGKKGEIIGPLNFNDQIIYVKVTSIDSAYRMRVGNIWLSPEKRSQENIDKLANEILKTVIRTGDFDSMSKKYSDDGNQAYEADLGWFFQGIWVPEYESEVLKHKKGDMYIVSSRFGKHIVKTLDDPVLDRSKVEYVLIVFDKK